MRLRSALLAAALTATALPTALHAHRLWMVPSATQVSGDDIWVTFDAAASNDLFYPDHQPLRGQPSVVAPDGSAGEVKNFSVGRYRATFDVQVAKQGTWKLQLVSNNVGGSYTLNGEEKRLPRGTAADQLATAVPAGATNVKLTESFTRNEVFVTNGAPTDTVLKPTGKGLELAGGSHPNDLHMGEEGTFRFTVDGKPAAGLAVTVVPGGSRYREALGDMTLTTDASGQIKVKWPMPGMYWLNVTSEGKSQAIPNAAKRLGYTATLEVMGS